MDKLTKLNLLKDEIENIKDFVSLLKTGGNYNEKYGKYNTFREISISAYIWTGTDNPMYKKIINNKDIVKICADNMIIPLEQLLIAKKIEFNSLMSEDYYKIED